MADKKKRLAAKSKKQQTEIPEKLTASKEEAAQQELKKEQVKKEGIKHPSRK